MNGGYSVCIMCVCIVCVCVVCVCVSECARGCVRWVAASSAGLGAPSVAHRPQERISPKHLLQVAIQVSHVLQLRSDPKPQRSALLSPQQNFIPEVQGPNCISSVLHAALAAGAAASSSSSSSSRGISTAGAAGAVAPPARGMAGVWEEVVAPSVCACVCVCGTLHDAGALFGGQWRRRRGWLAGVRAAATTECSSQFPRRAPPVLPPPVPPPPHTHTSPAPKPSSPRGVSYRTYSWGWVGVGTQHIGGGVS